MAATVLLIVGMAILTASSYSLIVDMASKDFVGVAFGAQYSVGVSGLGVAALVGLALGKSPAYSNIPGRMEMIYEIIMHVLDIVIRISGSSSAVS